MVGPQQLVQRKAANSDKSRVSVGDSSLEVGTGNQQIVIRQRIFDLGHGKIVAHACPFA